MTALSYSYDAYTMTLSVFNGLPLDPETDGIAVTLYTFGSTDYEAWEWTAESDTKTFGDVLRAPFGGWASADVPYGFRGRDLKHGGALWLFTYDGSAGNASVACPAPYNCSEVRYGSM